MRRRADVTGLPVVEIDSGRTVGRVEDLVFDLGRGRLEGLVVAAGQGKAFLPFDQVHSLGRAAVTIGPEAVLLPSAEAGTRGPVGKPVLTRDGREIGRVDDIIFDPDSGSVWGYEVTGGFIADFVDGRKSVPLTEDLVVGPDAVIASDGGEGTPG